MKQFQSQILKLNNINQLSLEEHARNFRENGNGLEKAVLSHQSSQTNRQRFLDRNAVLNHLVGTVIDAISILNQMGFNDEEFEDRMEFTLIKMNGDASQENSIRNRILPFEVHLTLRIGKEQIESFKSVCKTLGTKAYVLKTPRNTGVCDVKSISAISGTNKEAFLESLRLEDAFKTHGFISVRRKIETTTWHPLAPTKHGDLMPRNCYFRALFSIILAPEQIQTIKNQMFELGAHLSFNNVRVIDEQNINQLLTLRQYHGTLVEFEQDINNVLNVLTQHSIAIHCTSVDFVLYDTEMMSDSVLMMNS